mgnify:CR=1 FL=1
MFTLDIWINEEVDGGRGDIQAWRYRCFFGSCHYLSDMPVFMEMYPIWVFKLFCVEDGGHYLPTITLTQQCINDWVAQLSDLRMKYQSES